MGGLFQKNRQVIILIALFTFALSQVFSIRLRGHHDLNWIERTVLAITAPPEKFLTFMIDRTHGLWLDYIFLVGTRKQYREMQEKQSQLSLLISHLKEDQLENIRLRNLLGFKEKTKHQVVPAKVISLGHSSFTHSARINKGSKHGLEEGMTVVTAQGVVGHIINVTDSYANVILLLDPNSQIDVRDRRTRGRGLLKGHGVQNLHFQYLVKGEAIRVGSELITSGLDAIYPKGLTVGEVVEVIDEPGKLFMEAYVEPAVNFARLEEVLVITHENQTVEKDPPFENGPVERVGIP